LKQYADSLPEDVRADYLEQLTRLESSVKAARQERDDLDKRLRELPSQDDLESKLASRDREITFLKGAGAKGVKDTRLAWALASTEKTFKEDGSVDWSKLKELSPALFTAPIKTGAGSGTGGDPATQKRTMSDALRAARNNRQQTTT
jgi:hypothetical protein